MIYEWQSQNALQESPDTIGDLNMFKISYDTDQNKVQYQMGEFGGLHVQMSFQRRLTAFFVQVYIPAGLVVILSWIGFWINRNATPARARFE